MASIESTNIDSPDEEREFDKGRVEIVTLGDVTFARAIFQPAASTGRRACRVGAGRRLR